MPSQSSSTLLPFASNAAGFASAGSLHSVESQQSPSHVENPSPSRSSFSSTAPLQFWSTPSPQISATGMTWPSQLPQRPPSVHFCSPETHGPTPIVSGLPVKD